MPLNKESKLIVNAIFYLVSSFWLFVFFSTFDLSLTLTTLWSTLFTFYLLVHPSIVFSIYHCVMLGIFKNDLENFYVSQYYDKFRNVV